MSTSANILAPSSIQQWSMALPPDVWNGIRAMTPTEGWVRDVPNSPFLAELAELAKILQTDSSSAEILIDDNSMGDFIQVIAYAKATNAFRLLSLTGERQPFLGGDLLQKCQENIKKKHLPAESRLMLSRLLILARLDCFQRIFGEDRRVDLTRILDSISDTEDVL